VWYTYLTKVERRSMMSFNRKGFTLIELIIVVIIIGILAAIAGPMMSGNVKKAKKSEAVAAIGAIRTAERLYYVDKGAYPADLPAVVSAGFMNLSDLEGKYFPNTAYSLTGEPPVVTCDMGLSKDSSLTGDSNITIDWNGEITGN
jgi:prepilin-type N-terminal cleavage/methylation domain-containing protein